KLFQRRSFLLELARPNLKLRDHLWRFRKRKQRPQLLRLLAEKFGGRHIGTPLTREHRGSRNRTVGTAISVKSDQRHHPALCLGIASYITLRRREAGVAGELLDISQ